MEFRTIAEHVNCDAKELHKKSNMTERWFHSIKTSWIDALAISEIWKHYRPTDSSTGVGARRCYCIQKETLQFEQTCEYVLGSQTNLIQGHFSISVPLKCCITSCCLAICTCYIKLSYILVSQVFAGKWKYFKVSENYCSRLQFFGGLILLGFVPL